MAEPVALVTGAGGEMGRVLIPALREAGFAVAAVDLVSPPPSILECCVETIEATILDRGAMQGLLERHRPDHVYHLAAILSAKAENDPKLAHQVNVEGTLDLFDDCRAVATGGGAPIRFFFPSSIAVYGLPDARAKAAAGAVLETEWTVPTAVYGANKLYCELVGSHLSTRGSGDGPHFDFRSIRFPGLISAETVPSGGTTDYAPEMIHAAAQGKAYDCFVSEATRLPFMTMPDAVEATLALTGAGEAKLTKRVYNIRGFAATAGEIAREVRRSFPDAHIGFKSQPDRQALVDSWPADVDDSRARKDWGLRPRHELAAALGEYLIPALRSRYAAVPESEG